MLIIYVDCILGQWDTADPLLGSLDTGPDDTAKGCTIQPLYTRPCGQISSRCGVDVHCMGPPLSAVLPDGKGTLLSPLFSRSHVQLHAIWNHLGVYYHYVQIPLQQYCNPVSSISFHCRSYHFSYHWKFLSFHATCLRNARRQVTHRNQ